MKHIIFIVLMTAVLCIAVKGSNDEICYLELETGPCRAMITRYGFEPDINACTDFTYGGCKGNANNFETMEACQKACPGTTEPHPCD